MDWVRILGVSGKVFKQNIGEAIQNLYGNITKQYKLYLQQKRQGVTLANNVSPHTFLCRWMMQFFFRLNYIFWTESTNIQNLF